MALNRREFLLNTAAGAAALKQGMVAMGAPAGSVQVAIDAAKTGEPVSPLVFGGYMEPATARVWAEMLSDRKFARPITSAQPDTRNSPMSRFFRNARWQPVGPDESVQMDTEKPFVGAHSPRIKLDAATPRGIQQSALSLHGGKSYVGRIYLKAHGSAKIEVRLVWGPGAGDSKTLLAPSLSSEYQKFPFEFTPQASVEDARLEIVGTGDGAFHIGAVSLMPADNVQGFNAGMIKLYKDAGFTMAKWPGGNFVSVYDWRDGLGEMDKRPPRIGPVGWPLMESNDVGVHEYMTFCHLIGAEPDLAVNTGFGEPRSAAEEVEYMNGSADTTMGKLRAQNGHPEPYGVHLWCIGNEMYGAWQYGYMSLNQYWEKHNRFVEAMRKVDPTIKVTTSGASICEMSWCAADQAQGRPSMWKPPTGGKLPYQYGTKYDWDGWMLENCADNTDFLSEHTYAFPNMVFDAEKQDFVDVDQPVQFKARRDPNRLTYAFEAWQKYVQKTPALKSKNIKFAFDEWGNRFETKSGGRQGFISGGMVGTLSAALVYHEIFRHSELVGLTCPTAGFYWVVPDSNGEYTVFTGEGLVVKAMRAHFAGSLPVQVSGNSPQQPTGGTPGVDTSEVPSGSPTYPLDVAAAWSSDRKNFILSVVNPTESAQECSLQITGAKLKGPGKVWQIVGSNAKAVNEPGKKPEVELVEHAVQELGATLQVPALSINVYVFKAEA